MTSVYTVAIFVCILWVSALVMASSCSVYTDNNKIIELSSLDIADTGYNISATDQNWVFYFNICGEVSNPSNTTCTKEAKGYQYSKFYKLCFPMGQQSVQPRISLLPLYEGVKVLHPGIAGTDGYIRQILIYLKCDTGVFGRPTLSFNGEELENKYTVNYKFSGVTSTACPKPLPIYCFGIISYSSQVCNGNGICVSNDYCKCYEGYNGAMCEFKNSNYTNSNSTATSSDTSSNITKIGIGVVISFIIIIIIIVVIVLVIVVWMKYNRKNNYSSIRDNTHSFNLPLMRFEEYPKKSHQPLIIPYEELKIISKLGSGGFGSVYKAQWNDTIVSIKTIENESISNDSISKEALLMCSLSHKNIVDCFGVSSKDNLQVIVMEFVEGGSLEKTIQDLKKKYTCMDIDEKLSILLGICEGLNYLHTLYPKAIIHRDLKPANILLDRHKSICKLCDFGLSKPFSTNSVNSLTNNVGTVYYMAKELIEGNIEKEYATALDVYSFSVVMWELIFEESPYNYTNKDRLFFENNINPDDYQDINGFNIIPKVLSGFRPVMPITFRNCSKWCSKFIKSKYPLQVVSEFIYRISLLIQNCWNADPKLRPSINEIIKQLVVLENKLTNKRVD